MSGFTLHDLEAIIATRVTSGDASSWTARLVAGGMDKATKKLGEEAVEAVIAALGEGRGALVAEAADLLYHLLVVLRMRDISVDDVLAELERRTAQSGLEEKAGRREN
ncbi:phosphoribosyl-ATP diphosphatase [Oricola cellulosilytica]|uniref:Phosphoribosyl-ATP pyrophosphatase n=1 Tax=Oricola cellulosilytica TaxID=1429082 RepID=A0A4R0PFY3_9HYPH|nr:phosphoribosyl-ATP diphosphatase [Oricola cellulosilytica]TCD16008.1 phosphoribosyl-ATP diphosphatase [Oricola cellulosilytica]